MIRSEPRERASGALYIAGLTHLALWLGVPILHASAILYWSGGSPLEAATLFLGGQVSLAIAASWSINRGLLIHDIRLGFAVLTGLYALVNPIATIFLGKYEVRGIAGAVLLYATGMVGFNAVQLLTARPFQGSPGHVRHVGKTDFVLSALLVAGLALTLFIGERQGMQPTIGRIAGSRSGLGETNQAWVVTIMIMQGLGIYGMYALRDLGLFARAVILLCIAGFVLYCLGLGNRRDFTPLLVFAIGYYSSLRRISLRLHHVVALALILAVFIMYLGVARLSEEIGVDPKDTLILAASYNEFTFPIETAAFYATSWNHQPRLGSTYLLRFPQYLIPRALWPTKPVGLGVEFLVDAVGTSEWQGYAYTPVTEAFVNFGWAGPFIVFAAIGALLNALIAAGRSYFGLYLIVFSSLPDFSRGESGGWAYQLFIVFVAYAFACWLSGGRLRDAPDQPVRAVV